MNACGSTTTRSLSFSGRTSPLASRWGQTLLVLAPASAPKHDDDEHRQGAASCSQTTRSHTEPNHGARRRGAEARAGRRRGRDNRRMDQPRRARRRKERCPTLPRQDPQPHPQHHQRAEPRELALLAPPSRNRAQRSPGHNRYGSPRRRGGPASGEATATSTSEETCRQ